MKKITRFNMITTYSCPEYNEIMFGENHNHQVILDHNDTLRWEPDPVIGMIAPGGEYGCIGLNEMFQKGASKDDPRVRKLYRMMGVSLSMYWETFYDPMNRMDLEDE